MFGGRHNDSEAHSSQRNDIRAKSKDTETLFSRGRANYYKGNFSLAAKDFEHSLELSPTEPYPLLWLHLAKMHLRQPDNEDVIQPDGEDGQCQMAGSLVEVLS